MNSAEDGMWSAVFWKAAGERALRTFAQTLAALLVADATGLLDAAWVPWLAASRTDPSTPTGEPAVEYDPRHDEN